MISITREQAFRRESAFIIVREERRFQNQSIAPSIRVRCADKISVFFQSNEPLERLFPPDNSLLQFRTTRDGHYAYKRLFCRRVLSLSRTWCELRFHCWVVQLQYFPRSHFFESTHFLFLSPFLGSIVFTLQ